MTTGTGHLPEQSLPPLKFRQIFQEELQSFPHDFPGNDRFAAQAWANLTKKVIHLRAFLQASPALAPFKQLGNYGQIFAKRWLKCKPVISHQDLPALAQNASYVTTRIQQILLLANSGATPLPPTQIKFLSGLQGLGSATSQFISAEQSSHRHNVYAAKACNDLLVLLDSAFISQNYAVSIRGGFLELSEKLSMWLCRYDSEQAQEELQFQYALQDDLIGLSFSGGGIRSATFNLGVLQGLADCTKLTFDKTTQRPPGLLGKIHYLSSVSGGGYIAAWLAAWIQRDGTLENVERQLRPNRIDQATANRGPGGNQAVDPEPPPFHHLREFSNYLTPKTGIFSTDSWTLYSLYARNLIAIQSLLVPLLATVIFTVLSVAWFDVNFLKPSHAWYWFPSVFIPLALSSAFVACRLNRLRPPETTEPSEPLKPGSRIAQLILPLILLAHFISVGTFPGVVLGSVGTIYMAFVLYMLLFVPYIPPAQKHAPLASKNQTLTKSGIAQHATTRKNGSGLGRRFLDFGKRCLNNARTWFNGVKNKCLDIGKKVAHRIEEKIFESIQQKWLQTSGEKRLRNFVQQWSQVEAQKSVFLVMFLFVIAAASLTGFLASLIGCPAYETFEDPLSFLDRSPDGCHLVSSLTMCINRIIVYSRVSPLVASTLLNMAICAFARLLFHVHSLYLVRPHWREKKWDNLQHDLRWIFSGIVSGITSGGLLTLFEYNLIAVDPDPIRLAIFGPPLLLLVFALGEVMALAVLSAQEQPGVREWFAAMGGKILMAAGSWAAIFGLILSAPLVFARLQANSAALGSTLLWIASSVLSAKTAYRSKADGNRFSILDVIIRLGPPLFLIGLFLSAAAGAAALIQFTGTDEPYSSLMSFRRLLDLSVVNAIPQNATWLISFTCLISSASGVVYTLKKEYLSNKRQDTESTKTWTAAISFLLASVLFLLIWAENLSIPIPALFAILAMALAFLLGRFVNINLFSLQELYQNRLVRCYLGASRPTANNLDDAIKRPSAPFIIPKSLNELPRTPEPVTGFDEEDDFHLAFLNRKTAPPPANVPPSKKTPTPYDGPFHIFCTTLNLVHGKELAWQERMAESFVFTSLHAGSIGTGFRTIGRPLEENKQYGSGMTLGQVVALSGAAVSPNMGYYTTAPVTALLTIFNLRLGAWLGNPRTPREWLRPGPRMGWLHLLKEVLGFTDAEDQYVYISDGGHFDNLGAYELIRRRCRIVICCDAGADPLGTMHELGMLVRKVRTDFGFRIDINTSALKADKDGFCRSHAAVGRIKYSDRHGIPPGKTEDDVDGYLIYIKPSFTGDEPSDVIDYRTSYPDFPHQTTIDQFFSESQFESYRALGYHAIQKVFLDSVQKTSMPKGDGNNGGGGGNSNSGSTPDMLAITQDVYRRLQLTMNQETVDRYVSLNDDYARLQKELGSSPRLKRLTREIQWLGELLPLAIRDSQRNLLAEHRPRYTELINKKNRYQSSATNETDILAERQFLIQMMALMENAFFALNMVNYSWNTDFGWLQVLRIWRHSSIFNTHWPSFKQEFGKEFRDFLDEFHLENI